MKSHTDILQSEILAKFLPLESADMSYENHSGKGVNYTDEFSINAHTVKELQECFDEVYAGWDKYWKIIPCWSLAALLEIIPERLYDNDNYSYDIEITKQNGLCYINYARTDGSYTTSDANRYHFVGSGPADTMVDACVEIINKLHDLKKL